MRERAKRKELQIDSFDPVYTIGIAAKKMSVSPETLRLYERAGLLIPYKTRTGRRLYSLKDLEWIACIRRQIKDHKLNLAGIRRLLALIPCWDLKPCTIEERESCAAYEANDQVCWNLEETAERCTDEDCRICPVYQRALGIGHLKEIYNLSMKDTS